MLRGSARSRGRNPALFHPRAVIRSCRYPSQRLCSAKAKVLYSHLARGSFPTSFGSRTHGVHKPRRWISDLIMSNGSLPPAAPAKKPLAAAQDAAGSRSALSANLFPVGAVELVAAVPLTMYVPSRDATFDRRTSRSSHLMP